MTGEEVLDFDEMDVSQRDAKKSSALTLALIAIVIVFGFPRLAADALSVCCLIMVIAVTMATPHWSSGT